MRMKRPSVTHPPDTEQIIYSAARSMGWLVPTTEDEVAVSESVSPSGTALPDVLKDPFAALDQSAARAQRRSRSVPLPASDMVDALARAAREGKGDISPEAEAAMERDRHQAESMDSTPKKRDD